MILPRKTELTQKYFDKRWQSIYTKLKVEEFFRESDVNFYAMQDLFNSVIYKQSREGLYGAPVCYVCKGKCEKKEFLKFYVGEGKKDVFIPLHTECAEHWLHALWGWCATHAHRVKQKEEKEELYYETVYELGTQS